MVVVDTSRHISFVSPASVRLLGRDEDSLLGSSPALLPFADDAALVDGLLDRADPTSFTHPVEIRLRHLDGTPRWFEMAARDLRNDPEIEGLPSRMSPFIDGAESTRPSSTNANWSSGGWAP